MDKDRDLDDELRFHLEAEAEKHLEAGASPEEAQARARRELGNVTLVKEETRMVWTSHWWEQLLQDARYSWRQLLKSPATSAAAILSLGLAIGACMAAFRLIDALLLRPLPIKDSDNIYVVAWHGINRAGKPRTTESCSYPLFKEMRSAVAGQAELISASYSGRIDLTYGSDAEMEKAHRQLVSGWMFSNFGLQPALGRLLAETDDQQPGAHPYAVLSYDYWTRRFGQDPKVLGRTFRQGNGLYEIIGVLAEGFTGTEPGTMIDIFQTSSVNNATTLASADSFWLRPFLRPKPGSNITALEDRLAAVYKAHELERSKTFTRRPANYAPDKLTLDPVSAGVSSMQKDNRLGLVVLAVLVGLVLLIACANVGNLMLARALARAREMALRVSIGASRARLIRLILVESAFIAVLATILGAAFAASAAPFVVSAINPPNNPARIPLPSDWRVIGFGIGVALVVTVLFGLLPALRVSSFAPAAALKGGEDPHSRRRLMHVLIAVQVAFCFVVLFVGGLFLKTYDQLVHLPLGFSPEGVLALETVVKSPQQPVYWHQLAEHVRGVPGVRSVALSEWPLMSGEMSNRFIAFNGGPPVETLTYFFKVSPGWMDTMKVRLLRGRDLRSDESFPHGAVVNETFARTYFNGENPVGRTFELASAGKPRMSVEIVGQCADARYNSMVDAITPIAYVPFTSLNDKGETVLNSRASLNVRTTGPNPLALAAQLRREVTNFRPDFRVSNLRTQQEIVEQHSVRERLLAMLALFFSIVALVLAAVGLYGVLDYSVLQRRREIGIRLALGSPAADVVRGVTRQTFTMVALGAFVGGVVSYASRTYLESLVFGVKPNDWMMLTIPAAVLLSATLIASIVPTLRAIRLNPVQALRSE